MALFAYNLTGTPVLLADGDPPRLLPPSASPPDRGPPVNVTSEMRALTPARWAPVIAQVTAGTITFNWSGIPEYITDGVIFPSLYAMNVGYAPTNPGDWTPPPPTNVQDALDSLAASGGGPTGPGHLLRDFSFADVPLSPLLLGTVSPPNLIPQVVLLITAPFDRPVLLEVGRAGAPAELMVAADNNPAIVDSYSVQGDMRYLVPTALYLTLIAPGVPPTAGTGRVIVYFG